MIRQYVGRKRKVARKKKKKTRSGRREIRREGTRGEDAGDGFAKRGTRVSLEVASAPDLRGLTLGYLPLKPPATPVIAVTTRRRFIVAQSRSSDDSPVITRTMRVT